MHKVNIKTMHEISTKLIFYLEMLMPRLAKSRKYWRYKIPQWKIVDREEKNVSLQKLKHKSLFAKVTAEATMNK